MNFSCELKILENIREACRSQITCSQEDAQRFFKTSRGSYAEHDAFLGITVPNLRKISKKYGDVTHQVIEMLLHSRYNEERLLALLILIYQYQNGDQNFQEKIYQFYLSNLTYINNWNLVDASAHLILGHYLWDKDRTILTQLAQSNNLWERRISIVATAYFIRKKDLDATFEIAECLLRDPHDLIHKAVGWMLREAGKKDETKLRTFLSIHGEKMAKTMLRSATERLK